MDTVANLRAFLAVARYGGFSEAARQLNVVPSVAAKRVTQLEHAIGTKLFETLHPQGRADGIRRAVSGPGPKPHRRPR